MEQHLQKNVLLYQPQQNDHSSFLLLADSEDIIIDSGNNLERRVITLQKMGKNLKWKYCQKT
jgi:hypothetical protein